MRPPLSACVISLTSLALVAASSCARPAPEPEVAVRPEVDTISVEIPVRAERAAVARVIPYEGAFGPSDPPARLGGKMQKPIEPWVAAALDVWYERPSPKGPPPIPLPEPKAIYVVGEGPIIQALPGPPPFPDKIPSYLQQVMPPHVPFSNNIKRLPRGEFRAVAYDRTQNDTKLSNDSMAVEISFTDDKGDEWRIEQVMLAPISPNPIAEPWFGGLVIDTLYHGHTGNGTPAVPLVECALCSWGWADVYRNGTRVSSSAPLHVMVTSDTRAGAERNFEYQCYECTDNPVREVHIVVAPQTYLPTPGGFLHVMWEESTIRRGAPAEIAATAPAMAEVMPTIELSAAPYLTWNKKEIRVEAGKKYRLVVHNEDPSSFHQFHLHAHPSGHHHAGQDLRHEEGATAGGIGPLWKPGEEGAHAHGPGEPPAPHPVFFPLPQGSTWATMIQFDEPGEYEFMCPVGNHYRRGMEGHFIVTAPAENEGGAR